MDPLVNPWKVLDEKVVYENPWIRVKDYQIINPSGHPGIYGKVHFKNRAVVILPLDDQQHTWLVGQYRFVLDQYSWELPEGGAPLEEDPLMAAQRELREETGLVASRWQLLQKIHVSNSVSDEEAYLYLAQGLTQFSADPEETEQLFVQRLPFEEVFRKVESGEITDSLTIATVYKVKLLLRDGQKL